MASDNALSSNRRYEVARKIQDTFCELEDFGYAFQQEEPPSLAAKLKDRFRSSDAEDEKLLTFNQYSDKIPVDIIIPLFGSSDSLHECIESIENSEGIIPRVTLVDNGSDPLAVKLAQESSCVVATITNKENRGFGGACDQGIDASSLEYAVLLNSDATVMPDAIRVLIDTLQAYPPIGIAAATCYFHDGSIQEAGRVVNSSGSTFGLLENSHTNLELSRLVNVMYASYVCVAVRKSVYETVGGFDDNFSPAYSEDVDLSLRFRQHDSATVVAYGARVIHAQGESSRELSEVDALKEKNRLLLLDKHSDIFSELPTIDDPTKYPHEFSLARTSLLKSKKLVICPALPSEQELLSVAKISTDDFLQSEMAVIPMNSNEENSELRQSYSGFLDVYDEKKLSLHHWLRERICLFDEIIVSPNVSQQDFAYEISLLMATQPFAQWSCEGGNPVQ